VNLSSSAPSGEPSGVCPGRIGPDSRFVDHRVGELFPPVGFIVTIFHSGNRAVVRFFDNRGTAEQWSRKASTSGIPGGWRPSVDCEVFDVEQPPQSGSPTIGGDWG
jgi:hypothetical protein